MRHIYLSSIFAIATTGCSSEAPGRGVIVDSLLYSAAYHLGLEEQENRQELKRVLGVDPVNTEWCAAFVNAILSLNDIPGSESVSDYPLTARSFMKWGVAVDTPQVGDIVVFPRGNSSWQGHVGFFVKPYKYQGIDYYLILGGNQDNSVSYDFYPASKAIAIRRRPMESS